MKDGIFYVSMHPMVIAISCATRSPWPSVGKMVGQDDMINVPLETLCGDFDIEPALRC